MSDEKRILTPEEAEFEDQKLASALTAQPVPTGKPDMVVEQRRQTREIQRAMPLIVSTELQGPFFIPTFGGLLFALHGCVILAGVESDKPDGRPWYHISLSRKGQGYPGNLPLHSDLVAVREAMFRRGSVVVQVFPPTSEYVDVDDVLHLWERLGPERLVPDLREVNDQESPHKGKKII